MIPHIIGHTETGRTTKNHAQYMSIYAHVMVLGARVNTSLEAGSKIVL